MLNNKSASRLRILIALAITAALLLGITDAMISDSVSVFASDLTRDHDETVSIDPAAEVGYQTSDGLFCSESKVPARLYGILPLKTVKVSVYDDLAVYPGGMPFGIKLFTEGLVVVGFSDVDCTSGSVSPAYDAGLRPKDIIIKLNGIDIMTSEEFVKLVEMSQGNSISVTYLRNNEKYTTSITPSLSSSEGIYKTGMWLRDSTSGIGTVTFIMPDSGAFAGLGHGICDTETGELLPLSKGYVHDVTISGIVKGQSGSPGELKGYFASGKKGSLIKNTECGVFGIFSEYPAYINQASKPMKIALKDELKEGKATILCALDSDTPNEYEVTVSHINLSSTGNKNFVVTVTDPQLISKTGGIVQGMSGSPIIQNGKLVGAITHVLINDPTRGYGIFIENMLNAAD